MAASVFAETSDAGAQDAGATTYETSSLSAPASNSLILALVANSDGSPVAPSAVKYGGSTGEAFTQVGTTLSYGTFFRASLWKLVGPTATSGTVYAEWGSNQGERLVKAVSYQDVDEADALGTLSSATGTDSSPSVTGIAAVVGDLIADLVATGDTSHNPTDLSPQSSQTEGTEVATSPTDYDRATVGHKAATSTSETRSWSASPTITSGGWGIFGVAIKEAAAGGGTVAGRLVAGNLVGGNLIGRLA